MPDGSLDIRNAAAALALRLPEPLTPLASLAYNYWWSWAPGGPELFRSIDEERWRRGGRNPVRLLQEVAAGRLTQLAADTDFLERLGALQAGLERELAAAPDPAGDAGPRLFVCAEFGVDGSLPFYAGGLGVLAGDFLKQASDQRLPLVGVGLFYSQGSFHQHMDASGWQHEYWLATDSDRLPAAVVTDHGGDPLLVNVDIRGRGVACRVWRVDVGRVPLYLLDSDVPGNAPADRWITSRLYVSDREIRLAQYALLGIGGVRAIRAMGIQPSSLHLNEGHAALAALELVREAVSAGLAPAAARSNVSRSVLFTTHTPVAAGNESFPLDQVRSVLPTLAESVGTSWDELATLARVHPNNEAESFGLTPLALRLAGRANGVSRRHGQVSREMWRDIWPDAGVDDVPIQVVPNGVHLPTWIAPEMRELFAKYLPGWDDPARARAAWAGVDAIPDAELWAARCRMRARLAATVRRRGLLERLGRGEAASYAEAPERGWADDALTIGFARRIATYKRLYLLTARPERALKLLQGPPALQIVIAGRAHPQDDAAKRTVQEIFALNDAPGVGGHAVFLEEHDMALARELVQGCDLWINLPRPPQEASGTSGMKFAVNGGIHMSVLDGWWYEAFNGENGWAVALNPGRSPEREDQEDATRFYDLLEFEVVPLFYDRGPDGIPAGWLRKMKASLRSVGYQFSALRMLEDYQRLLTGRPGAG